MEIKWFLLYLSAVFFRKIPYTLERDSTHELFKLREPQMLMIKDK